MTDQQVIYLFKHYGQTGEIKVSAMKSKMGRKTAAKYIHAKKLPNELAQVHDWRTREDPLEKVWIEAESFLKDAPELEAKALFEYLLECHPELLKESNLRTFQRRVHDWHLLEGKKQEVFFTQDREPGECMQLDWTDMNKLNVIVAGKHYLHKLCHLVLPYSNYEGATRCRSESLIAIKMTLRNFLYSINATPKVLQVDNSSAATHQIKKTGKEREFNDDLTKVAEYYGFSLRSTNIDCPNENGDVESLNGHIKRRIRQALLLRKSSEFESMESYDLFLQTIFDKANKPRMAKLQEELLVMKAIPKMPLPEYQEVYVRVRSSSTIQIKKVTYSVPSRLIGASLKARIGEDTISIYNGQDLVFEMPKVIGNYKQVIDYRHVIHSLVRKPGAFKNYRFREAMYPTDNFRIACDKLISMHGEHSGIMEYLRTLKLATDTMEADVDAALALILEKVDAKFSYQDIEALVNTNKQNITDIVQSELIPNLKSYDNFINEGDENDICTNQSTATENTEPVGNADVLSGGDGEVHEGQLVPGEDITKFTGNRGGLSEGAEDGKFDKAIWNTASIYSGNLGSEAVTSETTQITTNIIGRELRGEGRESIGVWTTG